MDREYPCGLTEARVLEAIEHVTSILANSFKFGYHDYQDIKQQGTLFALQALEKYDGRKPLENFLYTHIKNRLINFKRDNFKRTDCPCKICPRAVDGFTDHKNGEYCEKYLTWKRRNATKQNIMNTLNIDLLVENGEEAENNLELNEIKRIIDLKLPVELRHTYLMMQAGESVTKAKRLEVESVVQAILEEHNICLNEDQ